MRSIIVLTIGALVNFASFVLPMQSYAQAVSKKTVSEEQEVPAICRIVAGHKPSSDTAYKPGVGIRGQYVVPADLNQRPFRLPETIKIPLTVDLVERIKGETPHEEDHAYLDGLLGEVELGIIEIADNGSIQYEGEDWSAPVHAVCEKDNYTEKESKKDK